MANKPPRISNTQLYVDAAGKTRIRCFMDDSSTWSCDMEYGDWQKEVESIAFMQTKFTDHFNSFDGDK